MTVVHRLSVALAAAFLLAGTASEVRADRNRYTGLRPGDEGPYDRFHRYRDVRILPYDDVGEGYGYGVAPGFGDGPAYAPRYDRRGRYGNGFFYGGFEGYDELY